MAGYLTEVAILQLVVLAPTVAYYVRVSVASSSASTTLAVAYVPIMMALWVFWIVATVILVRRIVRHRKVTRPGLVQRPLLSVGSGGT